MWSVIASNVMKRFAVRITLPIAMVIGAIGYVIEGYVSDKYTIPIPSVQDQRQKRLLEAEMESGSLKEKKFVPKTIFEKNLPPSLLEEDRRGEKYK